MLKHCPNCGLDKQLTEFVKDTSKALGYSSHCKQCKRAYIKSYDDECRAIAVSHYSNGTNRCVCCGEDDIRFLTIDHIDNNGADHRRLHKTANHLASWLVRHGLPVGYQILCWNCNLAKSMYGECPHRTKIEPEYYI